MTNSDLYVVLRRHAGHGVRLITRRDASVALVCEECNQVFLSADPEACGKLPPCPIDPYETPLQAIEYQRHHGR